MVEAEILTRVISPEDPWFDRKVAEAILTIGFKGTDRQRLDVLAKKARQGTLTSEEKAEAESYERVGHFISLLKSKARGSIRAGA